MTSTDTTRRRIAVVGGGVIGLATAIEMAAIPGAKVFLLEAGYPGGGSTSRSAGVFTGQDFTARNVELRARSLEMLGELEREGRITLRRIGFARLGRDSESTRLFEEMIALQREFDVESVDRVIDPDEFGRLVPDFDRSGVVSCLHSSTDGYTDGAVLCSSLAEEAQELGVEISVRTRLESARRTSAGGWELTHRGGKLEADVVVNCAGAWAGQVGELLGAPVALANERHEAFNFELPASMSYEVPTVMDYVANDRGEEGLYFRQEGDNQLVAGIHSNDIVGADDVDPDEYFEGVTEAGSEQTVAAIAAAFPGVEDIRFRGGWAGIYPHSADGRPIAGPHPDDESVFVGGGLGGIGLSLSLAMARTLREWLEFGAPRTISTAAELLPPAAGDADGREHQHR